MPYINTGEKGIPLRDIIAHYGNKNYDVIQMRIKWTGLDGEKYDELFGYCKYIDGELISLDEDSYSLDDLYYKWAEAKYDNEDWLIVWEYGECSNLILKNRR